MCPGRGHPNFCDLKTCGAVRWTTHALTSMAYFFGDVWGDLVFRAMSVCHASKSDMWKQNCAATILADVASGPKLKAARLRPAWPRIETQHAQNTLDFFLPSPASANTWITMAAV